MEPISISEESRDARHRLAVVVGTLALAALFGLIGIAGAESDAPARVRVVALPS